MNKGSSGGMKVRWHLFNISSEQQEYESNHVGEAQHIRLLLGMQLRDFVCVCEREKDSYRMMYTSERRERERNEKQTTSLVEVLQEMSNNPVSLFGLFGFNLIRLYSDLEYIYHG